MTYVCQRVFGPLEVGDILVYCASEGGYIFCWSPKFAIQFKVTKDQLDSHFSLR